MLRYVQEARERGIAIVFITHNVHHAYPLGDTFTILTRGRVTGTFVKGELSRNELANMMASGEDLEQLGEDFSGRADPPPVGVPPGVSEPTG